MIINRTEHYAYIDCLSINYDLLGFVFCFVAKSSFFCSISMWYCFFMMIMRKNVVTVRASHPKQMEFCCNKLFLCIVITFPDWHNDNNFVDQKHKTNYTYAKTLMTKKNISYCAFINSRLACSMLSRKNCTSTNKRQAYHEYFQWCKTSTKYFLFNNIEII